MAIDVSQLTDYSWEDIQKAAKTAMMTAALGGRELTIKDRTIGRITIAEAKTLYELATEMLDQESDEDDDDDTNGGVALAVFGSPR